jgi:glycosyl transferase, family 25
MKIYLINLDRHPQRLARMEKLLQGLSFQRIPAVDGRTVPGPEWRHPSRQPDRESLSRYEKACTMSHQLAWREFLAGSENYACILEDDLHFSPDFPRFIQNESWLPPGCDLIKIETSGEKVVILPQAEKCLDRSAAILLSNHFGGGGYILSRKGAAQLLQRSEVMDVPCDGLLFGEDVVRKQGPVYQLCPALCVQATRLPREPDFPELRSSIQPALSRQPKTVREKIRLEITRPFHQLSRGARILFKQWLLGARYGPVPFA